MRQGKSAFGDSGDTEGRSAPRIDASTEEHLSERENVLFSRCNRTHHGKPRHPGWLCLLTLPLVSCSTPPSTTRTAPSPSATLTLVNFSADELATILSLSPLPDPPPDPTNRVADDPAAAHFGQFLFFDRRLSRNGQTSCATCHDPQNGWGDGQSIPSRFSKNMRHTPTLWNVAYNRWFFWDGRADSLWSQALEEMEDPNGMAGSRMQYAHLVDALPDLRAAYEWVFGPLPKLTDTTRFPLEARPVPANTADPLHQAWISMAVEDQRTVNQIFANLGKAIAAYERRVISRRSPFDTFVEGMRTGDPQKIATVSASAQRGLKLHLGRAACFFCHHGPNFSDGEFHDDGAASLSPPGAPNDYGRFSGIEKLLADPFNSLGSFSDDPAGASGRPTAFLMQSPHTMRQFKTPTLRNSARTAPYLHRGQLNTLEQVVRFASTRQDPRPGAVAGPPRPPAGGHGHGGSRGETIRMPLNLSKTEVDDLVAFLESLTDESIDAALTRRPDSPIR